MLTFLVLYNSMTLTHRPSLSFPRRKAARSPGYLPGRGQAFGFGNRVDLAEEPSPDAGAYGWGDVGGIDFIMAPATGSFAVLMVQDIANRRQSRNAFREVLSACSQQ